MVQVTQKSIFQSKLNPHDGRTSFDSLRHINMNINTLLSHNELSIKNFIAKAFALEVM